MLNLVTEGIVKYFLCMVLSYLWSVDRTRLHIDEMFYIVLSQLLCSSDDIEDVPTLDLLKNKSAVVPSAYYHGSYHIVTDQHRKDYFVTCQGFPMKSNKGGKDFFWEAFIAINSVRGEADFNSLRNSDLCAMAEHSSSKYC